MAGYGGPRPQGNDHRRGHAGGHVLRSCRHPFLTTATIDRLRDLYPQGRFEVRRFRPNIVVEPASGEKIFVENAWIGHRIAIGDEVCLRITGPCPRCVMTTLPQGDLPRDPGILRTAAQHNQVNVGVYAAVLRGGTIRRGDPIRFE
ncbi:MAG: MOSC domain-containing protein [Planctomycetaceae bacterium]